MADGATQVVESFDGRRFQPAKSRPTLRNEVVLAEICKELEAGRTLRQACTPLHLPNRPTVLDWMRHDAELRQRIADARARGCDALAEETLIISDDTDSDLLMGADGRQYANNAALQRAKLRIDTRLKLAAVWNPKEYGAKSSVDVNATLSLEHLVLAAIGAAQPTPMLNVTPPRQEADPYDDLL